MSQPLNYPQQSIMDVRLPPVASLMSPPEPKHYDSFSPTMRSSFPPPTSSPDYSYHQDNLLPPISSLHSHAFHDMARLLSPPVSPYNHSKKKAGEDEVLPEVADNLEGASHTIKVKDPQLFPRTDETTVLPSDEPLFPPTSEEKQAAIKQHVRHSDIGSAKPTTAEYLLALDCVSIVSKNFNRNPAAYWRREQQLIDERYGNAIRVCKPSAPRLLPTIAPAPVTTSQKKNGPGQRVARVPRQQRTPKATPPTRVFDSFGDMSTYNTPKPGRVIGQSREDTDYNSLVDYCPPTSNLDDPSTKPLKADWRGQALDLRNDPDRHLLHPQEVNVAATLRLSCATYLCSKRRIFMAKVDKVRLGKEFRKTDAQQACRIDVNKASKLWTAFEKVGWFDPRLYTQYLH